MSQNSPTLLPSRETGASPSCLLAVNATNRSESPDLQLLLRDFSHQATFSKSSTE